MLENKMLKTEGCKQLTLMEGIFQVQTKMIYNACRVNLC